ncbi:MAG: hypothetical protein QOJ39_195 [Candidatus Eremiobacteraeota bacterium]|jgi:hypothetical protein|nr:hypothetical protein [Candidatus Eremiobacteraeota bacterium]
MKHAAAPGPALDSAPAAIAAQASGLAPQPLPAPASAAIADGAFDVPASLPRDHPAWQRDVLAVSARVRAIVARMRPVAVRVLTFWDHTVRRISIGGRLVEIDPSGCYRRR